MQEQFRNNMSNRDYTNTPKMIIGSESEKKKKTNASKIENNHGRKSCWKIRNIVVALIDALLKAIILNYSQHGKLY